MGRFSTAVAAACLTVLSVNSATADEISAGRGQLVEAINAAWIELLADGTYDQIMAQSPFPGAPPAVEYAVNMADCLPKPHINPFPDNPKGRFAEILATGEIVRASTVGADPVPVSPGDSSAYLGPSAITITKEIMRRIGEHYGTELTITDIIVPPPYFEFTSALVSTTQPRADFVEQVNATGGETQGLPRRESRQFSCTLAASGQFIHVPARLAATITSFQDLKANPQIRICSGNLSTQTMNAFMPNHSIRTERVNDIANCDALIASNQADVFVNPLPTLDIAESSGQPLLNDYTSVDTGLIAGTPLWVAKKNVHCPGSYDDFVEDICTTGNNP